jgi:ABC-2 type transport system permease protein
MRRRLTFSESVLAMLGVKWVQFRNKVANPKAVGATRSGTGRKGRGSIGLTVFLLGFGTLMSFVLNFAIVKGLTAEHSFEETLSVLAAIPAALFVFLFLFSFGNGGADAPPLDHDVEWMLTLPADTSAIYAAVVVEKLLSPLAWILVAPFLTAALSRIGYGALAFPLALTLTLPFVLLLAFARVLAEVLTRRLLGAYALRTFQVLASLATLCLVAVAIYGRRSLASATAPYQEFLRQVAEAVAWLPTGVGLLAFGGGPRALLYAAVAVVEWLALAAAGAWIFTWATRRGVEAVQSGYRGTRHANLGDAGRGMSIVGKDLRMLLRDKWLLVQVGASFFQILPTLSLFKPDGDAPIDPVRWGALSLAVGIWPLVITAPNVLYHERDGLWLLFTIPRSIQRIVAGKVSAWLAIAGGFSATLWLVGIGLRGPAAADVATGVFLLVGLPAFAAVAASIGVYGTDPYETEHRRVRQSEQLLIGFLGALLVGFLFVESPWQQFSGLLLFTLLAYAWWQKAAVYAEYILDPVEKPPSDIYLADAILAIVVFFFTQTILVSLLLPVGRALDLGDEVALAVAYAVAGTATLVAVNDTFKAAGIDIWSRLVFVERSRRTAAIEAALLPAAISIAVAVTYQLALPSIETLFGPTPDAAAVAGFWVAVLAVGCAPLIEEVLFRGLLYGGLVRSMSSRLAMLVSALTFTLVHPAMAAVPVFVLGLATAWAYRRSGQLLAPILVHAAYNAVVIFV